MQSSWDYARCIESCLDYTLTSAGMICAVSKYDCMCLKREWITQLLNSETPLSCIVNSCATRAQSSFVNGVLRMCASQQVFITSVIDPTNPLVKYLPTGTSAILPPYYSTPLSTSSIKASTSAFAPTTLFTSTTAPTSALSFSVSTTGVAPAAGASSGLGPKATGGIAGGVVVAGLAIAALLIWSIMRKRKRRNDSKDNDYTTGYPHEEQNGKSQDPSRDQDVYSAIYQDHNAVQELPGDDPPQSPNSNRLSELDSIRPVSELDSTETGSERWSAVHGGRVVSPMLPNVAEIGDGSPSPPLKDVASSSQELLNLPDNKHASSKRTDETLPLAAPASTLV
ncbi:hypothetical protein HBH71_240400 [Parastagonospora nodorum]|nr:hypothetical protein HBH71_240400 [Parastagonospora nodorum]